MRKSIKFLGLVAGVTSLAFVATVYPYGQLTNNDGGTVTGDHWELGLSLSNRTPGDGRTVIVHFGTNVSADQAAAIGAAHDTWESIAAIDFDDSPTFNPPGANLGDGFNTHQFNVILGAGILAVTPNITDGVTGRVFESDVFYSNSTRWNTSGTPRGNRVDVQSVAFHELGHFIGLAHSGEVDATMFPFILAGTESATPEPDDEISAALVYGQDDGDVLVPGGGISGRIIDGDDANDGKVCGVVYAFSADEAPISMFNQAYAQDYSGSVVGLSATANTSGSGSGFYQIDGLPDGDYFVLLDATGNVINANQISNWCATSGEADFPQEWYSGAAESNSEIGSVAALVTVSGGNITTGIDIITDTGTSSCGNGTCDAGEDECNCSADCGNPPVEDCTNGVNDDCDNDVDCADADCANDPACECTLGQAGDSCVDDAECCSNKCKGRSGAKTCK